MKVSPALELFVVEHWSLGTVGVGTTVDVVSVCVGTMGTFSMVDIVGVQAVWVLEHWVPSVSVSIVSAGAIRVGALVAVGVGTFCVGAVGDGALGTIGVCIVGAEAVRVKAVGALGTSVLVQLALELYVLEH